MAKRKRNRSSSRNKATPLFGDKNIYVTDAVLPRGKRKDTLDRRDAEMNEDMNRVSKAICKGQHMAKVEAYAKKHKCTITQAMIALM
jgi:hypothetical protein